MASPCVLLGHSTAPGTDSARGLQPVEQVSALTLLVNTKNNLCTNQHVGAGTAPLDLPKAAAQAASSEKRVQTRRLLGSFGLGLSVDAETGLMFLQNILELR